MSASITVSRTEPGSADVNAARFRAVGSPRRLAEITGKVLALKGHMSGLVVLPADDPTAAARLLGTWHRRQLCKHSRTR